MLDILLIILIIGVAALLGITVHPFFWLFLLLIVVVLLTRGSRSGTRL